MVEVYQKVRVSSYVIIAHLFLTRQMEIANNKGKNRIFVVATGMFITGA